jgi:hypothetical protein
MDTRFWGPPGWRMLHLLTFSYENTPETKRAYREFLRTLPFVLPCKFCRASLTDYYKKHPIEPALASRETLVRWLYDIHNEVNAKLRGQGLTTTPDPTFASVQRYYTTWLAEGASPLPAGWDFLFAIAYNHPAAAISIPMPDCPRRAITCKNTCTRNKWNTLPLRERLHWFKRFWDSLPAVLGPAWQTACSKTPCSFRNRQAAMATLWRLRCTVDATFHDPYRSVCSRVAAFSSGCSKARRGVTCRRRQGGKKE